VNSTEQELREQRRPTISSPTALRAALWAAVSQSDDQRQRQEHEREDAASDIGGCGAAPGPSSRGEIQDMIQTGNSHDGAAYTSLDAHGCASQEHIEAGRGIPWDDEEPAARRPRAAAR